jgi:hypothetical protein
MGFCDGGGGNVGGQLVSLEDEDCRKTRRRCAEGEKKVEKNAVLGRALSFESSIIPMWTRTIRDSLLFDMFDRHRLDILVSRPRPLALSGKALSQEGRKASRPQTLSSAGYPTPSNAIRTQVSASCSGRIA